MNSEKENQSNGLWNTEDVATYLGLKPSTIRDKVHEGTIPYVKLGGAVRFRKEDIDKWIEGQKVEPEEK